MAESEKRKESKRLYYLKNKSRLDAYQKEWNQANADRVKLNQTKWYSENRSHVTAYHQEWYKANRTRILAQQKHYQRQNAEKVRQRNRKYAHKNLSKIYARRKRLPQEVQRAYRMVTRAIRIGTLTKGVCGCGSTKVDAHHEDYSKPLDVVWMCRQCHSNLHKERKYPCK